MVKGRGQEGVLYSSSVVQEGVLYSHSIALPLSSPLALLSSISFFFDNFFDIFLLLISSIWFFFDNFFAFFFLFVT